MNEALNVKLTYKQTNSVVKRLDFAYVEAWTFLK